MRRFILAIAVVTLTVAAGALWAQSSGMALHVTGTVVSSSSDSLVVRTESGAEMTFGVDAQSVIPSTLTPDTRVEVAYHSMDGGTYHAAEVQPMDSGATTLPPEPSNQSSKLPSQEPSSASAQPTGNESLPRTASPIVLVGLIGLASLGAGASLRLLSR